MADVPRGDGSDVVVLPGFALGHRSTFLLRSFLSTLGYRVHDWGLGLNLGARTVGVGGERLAERIDKLSDGGARTVSLVGHSLGGVLARLYALAEPGRVRQVICLGSPFVGDPRAVNTLVRKIHDRLSTVPAGPPPASRPPVLATPFTAIYSRTDGIVAPSDCTDAPGARAENIRVYSSHLGLIAHPAVFYAVADRLAQRPETWRTFEPTGWRRLWYGTHEQLSVA
jgi:pimeloyl-ACP methyl ester carboxylesterase